MATRPSLAAQPVWRSEDIPPFPTVALKALNLMAGKETSLPELCNLIRPDVAFSTEVLRLANSPLIAFSKEVTSVLQASMLLGFRRLRSVVITVGLRAYMAHGFTPLVESCWRHSVACALIAERAAKACALDKDFAYTAGVMHDIGRVVLAISKASEYELLVAQGADGPRGFLHAERDRFGIDHCQAGGLLVQDWSLPHAFSAITSGHHNADERGPNVESVVSLSCLLADALGFGVMEYRGLRGYAEIRGAFPEPGVSVFPADGAELAADIKNAIAVIESA